jgi:hypothetical protein
MKRNYKIVELGGSSLEIEDALEDLFDHGWELISVGPYRHYFDRFYFKRIKINEND